MLVASGQTTATPGHAGQIQQRNGLTRLELIKDLRLVIDTDSSVNLETGDTAIGKEIESNVRKGRVLEC